MRTTTWKYQSITRTARRRFICRVCGVRGTKQKTFQQTRNHFNRKDVLVKTSIEIGVELQAKADAWQPDPIHDRCMNVSQ